MKKKQIVAVIGPDKAECSKEIFEFGEALGKWLVEKDYLIVCGGMYGFMEAVCKGAHNAKNYSFGVTIGILPSNDKSSANPYCDIVIPSEIGIARNIIIVNTADFIIACGGGSGTLSEIAFAWQKNKKVYCFTAFQGWSEKLAGKDLDQRNTGLLIPVADIEDLSKKLFVV